MQSESSAALMERQTIVQVSLTPERIETLFGVFERAEERGAWHCVAHYLEGRMFERIRKFADDQLLRRIRLWEEKLAKAREYEAVHGPGSLYVKDHPANLEIEDMVRQANEKLAARGSSFQMRSWLNEPTTF